MNHRDRLTDELLSAYLDGELTGEELERVERALAEDASCQQTLDELKSLRVEMQVLPRYQLDERFHERVLTASRRKPRVPGGVSDDALSRDGDAVERGLGGLNSTGAPDSTGGKARPIVYALLALAAALVVMLGTPGEKGREKRAARDAMVTVPGTQSPDNEDPGSLVAVGPAEHEHAEAEHSEAEHTEGWGRARPAERDAAEQAAAEGLAAKGGERAQGGASGGVSPEGDRRQPETRQLAGGSNRSGTDGSSSSGGDRASATDSAARMSPERADLRPSKPVEQAAPAADPAHVVGAQGGDARPRNVGAEQPLLEYLLVVNVDVTPAGTKKQAFVNALQGHRIRFEADLDADDALERALLNSQMLAPIPADAEDRAPVELFYVVATGGQIDSAVNHLANSELVGRVRLDVAMKNEQIQVFRKLRLADARDRAARQRVADQFGRARRLLLDLALMSSTAQQLGAQGLLTSDPDGLEGLLPAARPNVGDEQGALGANQLFEVLFVVRRP